MSIEVKGHQGGARPNFGGAVHKIDQRLITVKVEGGAPCQIWEQGRCDDENLKGGDLAAILRGHLRKEMLG